MRRTVRALTLMLAAAALLLTPTTARENGWLKLSGSALGMGTEPRQAPAPPAHSAAESPARPAPDAVGNASGGRVPAEEPGPDRNQTRSPDAPEEAEPVLVQPPDAKTANAGRPVVQGSPKPRREAEETEKSGENPEPAKEDAAARPWRAGETAAEKARQAGAARPQAPPAADGQGGRQADAPAPKVIRLFGTVAFRGNFNALPKWKRVLSKAEEQVRALGSCTSGKGCPPGATSWQRIMAQARGLDPMEQLRTVNTFFNKWPYRLDQDVYGTSDWWATPQEFLKLSGDCEDFAITKYYALRELGHSPDNLRIVVLQDRIRGIAHAILTVILDGDAYVLDNVTSVVFSHSKYSHYVPYYSLNENYRWSHIPVDKKP